MSFIPVGIQNFHDNKSCFEYIMKNIEKYRYTHSQFYLHEIKLGFLSEIYRMKLSDEQSQQIAFSLLDILIYVDPFVKEFKLFLGYVLSLLKFDCF